MWVGNVNLTYKTDAEEQAAGDTLIQTDSPSHRQSIGVFGNVNGNINAMAISMQYQEQQAGGEKRGQQ